MTSPLTAIRAFFQDIQTNVRGDLFGGLTAGVVALPLALAFGEQTELGAIAGLYGAIAIGIVAAIFGGTKTQISGPTAPMTVVSALIIADAVAYSGGSLEMAFPIIIATFFIAGLFESLMGVFRLGTYIKYIPYPVISGFMTGIGVIIIITQIFPFFGVSAPSGGPLATIKSMHKIPEIVNFYSIGVAVATIAIIYAFPRISKKVPSALVALIILSLAAYFLLPEDSILKINSKGAIPTGLPELELGFIKVFGDWKHMMVVMEYAFTLAALGAIDSLLTSVVADNMTTDRHDSNQELVGQGIGNMAAALIGGLPGAGATMRTVININTGGRTKLSGIVAGGFLLLVLLGLGALVGHVPNAVLAGILITVGIGIMDYRVFKHIRSLPKSEVVVMLTVLFLTVFVDLLIAVAIGMVLSALLFMKKISEVVDDRTYVAPLRDFSREVPWIDEGDIVDRNGDRVYIKHLDGPLFFGFASRFQEMVRALPNIKYVVMRMDKVPYMDQSGLYALEDAILDLKELDVQLLFVNLQGQPLEFAEMVRMVPDLIPYELCFDSFKECGKWIEEQLLEEERKGG